jgi:hypothetical protein
MKFLYSDTQDYVDPSYDFLRDCSRPGRERYWDDAYPHEIMDPVPYDGLLIAMSAVRQATGVSTSKVRYSTKEEQRMLRDGARKFLRFDGPKCKDLMLMGDCGAFAYVDHPIPAYSPKEVVDFYTECGFTHGVSPDHVIFECDLTNPKGGKVPKTTRSRFDITLTNAEEFYRLCADDDFPFEPMGAVQGWSPASMADAAKKLESMGYKYLAIGGMVPLKPEAIKTVLAFIRSMIRSETKLHLLGFAKAETIQEFTKFGITSFDSTSPLIRAFKDNKANYFIESPMGGLDYYTAIRIPQAMENSRLMQGVKRGIFSAEDLQALERKALDSIRSYDRGGTNLSATLSSIMDYHQFLLRGEISAPEVKERELEKTRARVQRTLEETPWKRCRCDICKTAGVEVIIFRASNRNKRRGFHNLGVYHKHLKKILRAAYE